MIIVVKSTKTVDGQKVVDFGSLQGIPSEYGSCRIQISKSGTDDWNDLGRCTTYLTNPAVVKVAGCVINFEKYWGDVVCGEVYDVRDWESKDFLGTVVAPSS